VAASERLFGFLVYRATCSSEEWRKAKPTGRGSLAVSAPCWTLIQLEGRDFRHFYLNRPVMKPVISYSKRSRNARISGRNWLGQSEVRRQ